MSKTPKSNNWKNDFKKSVGIDVKHFTITLSHWIFKTWDINQYPELAINDNKLLSRLKKLSQESYDKPSKSEGPLETQIVIGRQRYLSKREAYNILTNPGMAEMGKRSTGESSSVNGFHAIGSGTTSETISDTTLETELARKAIGTAVVTNQTEQYGSAFTSDDLVSPPQAISEAGIFTLIAGGIMILRVTATPFNLEVGKVMTVQTDVTHQNGVEI